MVGGLWRGGECGCGSVCACVRVCVSGRLEGRIAQSVERSANNAVVLGSSPSMTISFARTALPQHTSPSRTPLLPPSLATPSPSPSNTCVVCLFVAPPSRDKTRDPPQTLLHLSLTVVTWAGAWLLRSSLLDPGPKTQRAIQTAPPSLSRSQIVPSSPDVASCGVATRYLTSWPTNVLRSCL